MKQIKGLTYNASDSLWRPELPALISTLQTPPYVLDYLVLRKL